MHRDQLLAEFFDRMANMRRLMANMRDTSEKGSPTHAQFAVLIVLSDGAKNVKELAELFGMTSSAVTQLVNGLVTAKLLTRRPDADDRRKIVLSLTALGRAALAKAQKTRRNILSKLLAPLSDNEVRQLHAMQEKIIAHLRNV